MSKTTKIEKLSQSLKNGQFFTIAQIKKKFRLKNPRAAISDLRARKLKINKTYAHNTMYYYTDAM